MRVIALRTLRKFIESRPEYADGREPALAWYRQVLRADWESPAQLKREIHTASVLKDGRAVFNVAGSMAGQFSASSVSSCMEFK